VAGLSCDEAILDVTGQCYPSDELTNHKTSTSGAATADDSNAPANTSATAGIAGSASLENDEIIDEGPVARAASLAAHLRAEIERATQGCTCSIGIGPTKILARVALSGAKPNGTWHLSPMALAHLPRPNGGSGGCGSSDKSSPSSSKRSRSSSKPSSVSRANRLVTDALSRVRLVELPQLGAAALAKLARLIQTEPSPAHSMVAATSDGSAEVAAAAKAAAAEARAAQKKLTVKL